MSRILYTFFLLIILSFSGICQQSAKGFAKLNKNDLPKASAIFKESLLADDQDLLANYGMAIICSNNTYDKCDYFSAFRYIRKAENIVKGKDDLALAEFKKTFPDIKGSISADYEVIEKKLYEFVIRNQSLENVEKFANEFSDSKYFNDIIQFRNHLEYEKIAKSDTSTVKDYDLFIERFPEAQDRDEAVKRRDNLAYKDLCKEMSLIAVYNYINRYPKSGLFQRITEIRDSLEFVKTTQVNTLESYSFYLSHFPSSNYNGKAVEKFIQKYYEQVQERNTSKDYQDFLTRFLKSEPAEGALYLRDNLIFQEIQTTNTVETYNRFISWYPNSQKKKDAIRMRDQKAFEDAKAMNSISGFEEFINLYPAAGQITAAFRIRDSLIIVQVSKLTDIRLIDQFLHPYPALAQNPLVLKIKAPIAFKEAQTANTKEAWEQFLLYYSNSEFEAKAKEMLNKAK
jgi:outer membrane protein assembly factor BamD (BamD/ComL family)